VGNRLHQAKAEVNGAFHTTAYGTSADQAQISGSWWEAPRNWNWLKRSLLPGSSCELGPVPAGLFGTIQRFIGELEQQFRIQPAGTAANGYSQAGGDPHVDGVGDNGYGFDCFSNPLGKPSMCIAAIVGGVKSRTAAKATG
jgi:hypothetical protein